VSITDSQNEGNNTPASAGKKEIPYCLGNKKKKSTYWKYREMYVACDANRKTKNCSSRNDKHVAKILTDRCL